MKKEDIKTENADAFKNEKGEYIFPFQVLDDRTDGSSLGRIHLTIELLKGKRHKDGRIYIENIMLTIGQTRDERYKNKIFLIPCFSESIMGSVLSEKSQFMHHVWRVGFCEIHKELFFNAYPRNEHKALRINTMSSIGMEIEFI